MARSGPAAILSSVDLPQPLGPTTETNLPAAIWRSTGRRRRGVGVEGPRDFFEGDGGGQKVSLIEAVGVSLYVRRFHVLSVHSRGGLDAVKTRADRSLWVAARCVGDEGCQLFNVSGLSACRRVWRFGLSGR